MSRRLTASQSPVRVFVHDFARPEAVSDATGRFHIRGVPDGELPVVAAAPGYDGDQKKVSVEAAASDVVLRLPPDRRQ